MHGFSSGSAAAVRDAGNEEGQALKALSVRGWERGLSTPLRLTHHQGRHLLRWPARFPDPNATAAAGIPAERKQLGLEKEPVFFEFAEHIVVSCRHDKPLHTVTLLLIGWPAGGLWLKKGKSSLS